MMIMRVYSKMLEKYHLLLFLCHTQYVASGILSDQRSLLAMLKG